MLLHLLLKVLIVSGDLTVIEFDGRHRHYGKGTIPGVEPVTLRLTRRWTSFKIGLDPALRMGEAFMDGEVIVENGTIYDFLCMVAYNVAKRGQPGVMGWQDRLQRLTRFLRARNPIGKARRNASHHYDISGELYRLFLDPDMQYSCAYFDRPGMSLDQAQRAKKRHIAAKLLLRPGDKVLDIGCGWGGLGLSLAEWAPVSVTGITLSEEQLKVAQDRAQAADAARVSFKLQDYRELSGQFDRIVSVGMFEHVGVGNYPAFFNRVRELLTNDGVALIHSIGRSDGPGVTNPWIRKYIFPGGYMPALSEVLPAVERAGLIVTDIEILRLHYADTLREWRRRFMARRDRAAELYDERFCRMWEFYLAGCEASFRFDGVIVFQMQLAKSIDAVPLTRDYIGDWERGVEDKPSAPEAVQAQKKAS